MKCFEVENGDKEVDDQVFSLDPIGPKRQLLL